MAQWVRSDLFVLTIGMLLFVATLVGVTLLLSLARQSRTWRTQRSNQRLELASLEGVFAAPKPLPTLPRVTVSPLPERDLAAERQTWVLHDAAPDLAMERKRWTIHDATPDHFMIEPENGPTRHERNVQRLIAYLKEEAAKTAAPVS